MSAHRITIESWREGDSMKLRLGMRAVGRCLVTLDEQGGAADGLLLQDGAGRMHAVWWDRATRLFVVESVAAIMPAGGVDGE